MILYHGTSTEYLDRILRDGILPREATRSAGNYGDDVASYPDLVYLTSAYGVYYACGATAADDAVPVVLAVEVDEQDLFPDEDFIADCLRRVGQGEWKTLRRDVHPYFFQSHWQASLKHNGVVCTHAITPDRIVSHRVIPYERVKLLFALGMDALPSMDNFSIYGPMYRDCMAALFDEPDLDALEARVEQIHRQYGEEPWPEVEG